MSGYWSVAAAFDGSGRYATNYCYLWPTAVELPGMASGVVRWLVWAATCVNGCRPLGGGAAVSRLRFEGWRRVCSKLDGNTGRRYGAPWPWASTLPVNPQGEGNPVRLIVEQDVEKDFFAI